jgi:hypothetical protein
MAKKCSAKKKCRKAKKRKCRQSKLPAIMCGHLQHIPDLNNRTVAYQYRFKIAKDKKEQVVTATWDERTQRVMQDEPIPLIARLAVVGWNRDHDPEIDPADREVCAVGSERLTKKSLGQPDRFPDFIKTQLRTRDGKKITIDAQEPYALAAREAALAAINRHADNLGIVPPADDPIDNGQDDGHDTACPPGTTINGVPC